MFTSTYIQTTNSEPRKSSNRFNVFQKNTTSSGHISNVFQKNLTSFGHISNVFQKNIWFLESSELQRAPESSRELQRASESSRELMFEQSPLSRLLLYDSKI